MSIAPSWYSAMVAGYTGPQPAPFPAASSPANNLLEFAIHLGATQASSAGSDIALWTMPGTGILATAELVLQLTATLQDMGEGGAGDVYNAGVVNLDVVVPLSDVVVLRNTCPSPTDFEDCDTSGQALTLYVLVDLAKHLDVDRSSPDPNRTSAIRSIDSKGLRGVQLRDAATKQPMLTVNGTSIECQAAVMQQMNISTNCFPGSMDGCKIAQGSSTPATVFADGRVGSQDTQCVAPYHGTQCTRMYMNAAPSRFLLFANMVPKAAYNTATGAWVPVPGGGRVLYFRHGASSGVYVPNSTPCFPYSACGADASPPLTRSTTAWVPFTLAAVAVVVACTAAYMWLHTHHARSRVAEMAQDMQRLASWSEAATFRQYYNRQIS